MMKRKADVTEGHPRYDKKERERIGFFCRKITLH